MSYFYLYRINGGEVLGVSTSDSWGESAYFEVFESESAYELSPPKWCDGETLRNATTQEIEQFAVAQAEDQAEQDKDEADAILNAAPGKTEGFARLDRATIEAVRVEINTLRALHSLSEYTSAEFKALIHSAIDSE